MSRRLMACIALAASLGASGAWAKCNHSVDPKRVVFFLDLNDSLQEIPAAEAAACENGETLVVIPPVAGRRDISAAQDLVRLRERQSGNCHRPTDPCWIPLEDANRALQKAESALPKVTSDLLTQSLKALASQGKAIQSLVISGHDGGGQFSGATGNWDRSEIIEALKQAYSRSPELLGQLKTVLGWGCYSADSLDIQAWKSGLPSLKIIAGFVGSAPASSQTIGHEMMTDVLVKSETALRQCDDAELRKAILGIQGLKETLSGAYVSSCREDYYYSRSYAEGNPYNPIVEKLERFAPLESCPKFESEMLPKLRTEFAAYFDGTEPIPEDTDHGALRAIYAPLREHAQCLTDDDDMDPDRVALLLFFKGVKENFVHAFSDTIAKAGAELSANTAYRNSLVNAGMDPSKLTADGIQNMTRAEIIKALHILTKLPPSPDPATKKLYLLMNAYLYELHPGCMPFLQWHEYSPGTLPSVKC